MAGYWRPGKGIRNRTQREGRRGEANSHAAFLCPRIRSRGVLECGSTGVMRQVRIATRVRRATNSEGEFHQFGLSLYFVLDTGCLNARSGYCEFGFGPGGMASLGCGEGVAWGD